MKFLLAERGIGQNSTDRSIIETVCISLLLFNDGWLKVVGRADAVAVLHVAAEAYFCVI